MVDERLAHLGTHRNDPSVALHEFIAREHEDEREPLVLCDQGALLPAAGLAQLVGAAGDGKTTFAIDFALHAAAGKEYLGLRFPSPVRVLFVELEGPRKAFRDKLAERLREWTYDGAVRVWDPPGGWGTLRLSEREQIALLRYWIEQHGIDLVIADSLTRFGVRGNGTPEETRDFMELLMAVGLSRDVAFLLLHHTRSRLDSRGDRLEQISGAWAPHADAILMLKRERANRARLSYPKLRWARGDRPDSTLSFDSTRQTFALGVDSGDSGHVGPVNYERRVLDYLAAHPWAKTDEIEGGAGGRRREVGAARQRLAKSGRIVGRPSAELGRPGRAKRWNLASEADLKPVPDAGTPWVVSATNPEGRIPVPSPLGDRGTDGAGIDGTRTSAHRAIDAGAGT